MVDYNSDSYDISFRRIIFILFCITGISSIIYPLILMRYFQTIFGNTLSSNLTIISTYILGLALGGYLVGRFIDIKRNEIKTFMYLEFATSIFALILYLFFNSIVGGYRYLCLTVCKFNLLLNVINFLLSFLFFIPLTTFIGAKFSVLGRYLIRSENLVAKEIGILHSSYFLGMAIGSLLFMMLTLIVGIKPIIFGTVIINFAVGFIVRIFLHKFSHPQNIVAEFYDQRLRYFSDFNKSYSPTLINFILIGNGITSLVLASYIILLSRNIFYFTITNLFVHSIVITFIILSIVLGGYISVKFIREDRNLFFKFLFFQFFIGILILISLVYLPKIITFNQKLWLQQYQEKSYFSYLDIIFLIITTLILIGILFPIMFKIYLTKFEQIGKRIGRFYAVYFIGIILGLLITYYIIMPLIGIINGLITLAGINFILVLFIILKTIVIKLKYKILISCPILIIILSFYIFFPNFYDISPGKNEKIIAKKGNDIIFSVNRNLISNELLLKVNGSTLVGTSLPYIMSQRLLAHIPMLLNKNPKNVFVSGFGNGEIPWAVTNYQVERIDCSETSSEIIELSKLFSAVNHNIIQNTVFNLITIDGVTYLHITDRKYDVIINNYIHPEFVNNYIFYTKEYFQYCHKQLNSNGIMALSVPLINFSFDKLKVLINTFKSEFKNTTLWFNNNNINYHLLLIGCTEDTLRIDVNGIYNKIQSEPISMNLVKIGLNSIFEILDCYICGPNSLMELLSNTTVNSINHPYTNFTKETKADKDIDLCQYFQLFKKIKEPVSYMLENIEIPENEEDFILLILDMYYKSSNYMFDAFIHEFNNNIELALQTYRLGYQINKLDHGANRFIDAYYDPLLIPEPQTPVQFAENGKIYYQKMEYQKSIEMFNKSLKIDNRYAPAYFGLGINYEILNEIKMAKRMYRKTLRLKPKLKQARERLDSLIKKEQEFQNSFKRGIFNK